MGTNASALDVAQYILDQHGPLTAMKLQKLCYYSQAWSLVWDEEPLFQDEIQAWANGPVIPRLYAAHRGKFTVDTIGGDGANLDANQKDTIDKVVSYYKEFNPQQLSNLTHMEAPWLQARRDTPDGVRGNSVITLESMGEYYSGL